MALAQNRVPNRVGVKTLSLATFEKAVANAADRAAAKTARRDAESADRAFRNAMHPVCFVRETEKAVAAEVLLGVPGGGEDTALVWFPKSLCDRGGGQNTALVPGWLIREREEAAPESFKPHSYYESHRVCKGERAYLARGVEILAVAEGGAL